MQRKDNSRARGLMLQDSCSEIEKEKKLRTPCSNWSVECAAYTWRTNGKGITDGTVGLEKDQSHEMIENIDRAQHEEAMLRKQN